MDIVSLPCYLAVFFFEPSFFTRFVDYLTTTEWTDVTITRATVSSLFILPLFKIQADNDFVT